MQAMPLKGTMQQRLVKRYQFPPEVIVQKGTLKVLNNRTSVGGIKK